MLGVIIEMDLSSELHVLAKLKSFSDVLPHSTHHDDRSTREEDSSSRCTSRTTRQYQMHSTSALGGNDKALALLLQS